MLVWILIALGTVILDQVSKLLIVKYLDPSESFVFIKGILRFTYVENDGAAFGMLDNHRWIFMVLSLLGIAALCVYLWKFTPPSKLAITAIAFIIGGGIGNMIDRIRLGFVIDFIDFYAVPNLWKWVFNVADAFVCIGAGMLILYLLLDIIKDTKAKKVNACSEGNDGNA